MNGKKFLFLMSLFVCTACVARPPAIKPGYDFSGLNVIGIVESGKGPIAAIVDECARQLMRKGYTVKILKGQTQFPFPSGVDGIFEVNATQFLPDKKFLVNLGDPSSDQDLIVLNPTIELSGRSVYVEGAPFGLGRHGGQILISAATVSLSARLQDPEEGDVIWSNSSTYEGLDLQTALEGAANYLIKSLPSGK